MAAYFAHQSPVSGGRLPVGPGGRAVNPMMIGIVVAIVVVAVVVALVVATA